MQGALKLLAIPDVRSLLEEGGLDWNALLAVATGKVVAGSEVLSCSILASSVRCQRLSHAMLTVLKLKLGLNTVPVLSVEILPHPNLDPNPNSTQKLTNYFAQPSLRLNSI